MQGVVKPIVLLMLVTSALARPEDQIPFESKRGWTVIEKVQVVDCRAVKGFLGTPVDGSTHSWDYRGTVREYPKTASDGVAYSYNDNDGLHITLMEDSGFDLIILRGGAQARVYADIDSVLEPTDRKPIWCFPGSNQVQLALFDKRVKAKRVSFFGVKGGAIADVSFYRLEEKSVSTGEMEVWVPNGRLILTKPKTEFAPESIYLAMKERYPDSEPIVLRLIPAGGKAKPVRLKKSQTLHLITPPWDVERGLDGIALEMVVSGERDTFVFTAVVQDPLDPRLDLMWLVFKAKSGYIRLMFDIPDQVLLKDSRLWLTLRFDTDVTLSGVDGGPPKILLRFIPRNDALSEALVWRKFLLKTFFSLLSEPRPWTAYEKQSRDEFYRSNQYAGRCPELFITIDQCYALDPEDNMIRQYREWVYLHNLDQLSEVPPPPQPPVGVPEWAWYPRLAWLEVRRIAKWWVDNRMVPTGEFGGRVGDDTDMYQQFADLPFFEEGGVGAELKKGAANLAELAWRENLEEGINIHTMDALHAYEEGINHLALVARWFYGDPIYIERCMVSARNVEKLTILTSDGRRHFRDKDRMGLREIKRPGKPKIDGGAAPLMWHTALQVADYNRNPTALRILRQWADTWLRFMKPGKWATDVEVVTGRVVGFQKNRPLYGGYWSQGTVFTWLYGLTGDKRYLKPFLYYYKAGKAPHPSHHFLGEIYTLGGLKELPHQTLLKLTKYSPPLALYVKGDPKPLIRSIIGTPRSKFQEISTLYDAIRWPDMYTVTEQFTDRIFPSLLQYASVCYLGGFTRRNKFNPILAVSWEGFGTDYAALVTENKTNRLRCLVYSFAQKPMKGRMRIWALEHGIYDLKVGKDLNGDLRIDEIERQERLELRRADRIDLTLSPREVTVVELCQVKRLDPIFTRADLAITAKEIELDGRVLKGVVHNIGSSNVPNVHIAVIDDLGRVITEKWLGELPAPVDLVPKRVRFTLVLPSEPLKGWSVIVDPEDRVPEIYEVNNRVFLVPD